MKKVLAFVLSAVIILSTFVTVSAAKQTYGADNFNDEKGNLVIGFIGGSVTEGSGSTGGGRWSSLVTDYYKKAYKNKTVTELNAGIGGTGSGYGIIRMKNDLKLDSKKDAPDIVFIEFSINDATSEKRSEGKMRNMDSLIRQLLNAPKIPVIVMVHLTKASGNEYEKPNPALEYSMADFHEVAEHYGIHEIDVNEYIWNKINDGEFVWREIAGDSAHPNNVGYAHYADCIISSLEANKDTVYKKIDPSIAPAVANPYGDIEEWRMGEYQDEYVLSDGWYYVSPTDGVGTYSRAFFEKGWYECDDAIGQTIEFEFRGVGFGVTTSRNKNNCLLKWELFDTDNNLVKSGTYTNYYATDSDRCFGWLEVSDLPYAKYKVVLTGELNQQSIDDYTNSQGQNGGNGKYMKIEGFSVLSPTEEQKKAAQAPSTEVTPPTESTPSKNASTVVLAVGKSKAFVNGNSTFIDTANASVVPKVENGRTLVPVRFIAESFSAEVGWNDATKIITINYNGTETRLKLGLNEMRVGDKTITLDVPVKEENGRTLLPLRAICEEVLGKTVFWDDRGLIVISDEKTEVNVEDWLNKLN